MSKAVSRGQALQVSARVATQVDWDELDGECLQREVIDLSPEEFGERFTAFLKNGARVIIGKPKVISIDRSKPFNPTEFLGWYWDILEEDDRSLALTEVDLSKIRLMTFFKEDESFIAGEQRLKRVKEEGHIRLDAKIFQVLWKNKHLIPEAWKHIRGNIFFDGTVLLYRETGGHCILSLRWDGVRWFYNHLQLNQGWNRNDPSAVLAK